MRLFLILATQAIEFVLDFIAVCESNCSSLKILHDLSLFNNMEKNSLFSDNV